ncbi:MAG: tRNA (cytidine(34)-2'-O)-methyltransferase [Salinarimonadaceae bacterium]|nr:MAG: tRNA (cytidine(34)-2'-O)-methyltransferase [Salinarimonadaceae bacterium]
MRLVLFQPDIPQNTGTMIRLAACLGVAVDIVEPAGFDVSDRNFRRSGMDYLDRVEIIRHPSWRAFEEWRREKRLRLVLATTRGATPYFDFSFGPGDAIVMGRESTGAPDYLHEAAQARVRVPLRSDMRSLNVAVSAGMILGEALRQIKGFPD